MIQSTTAQIRQAGISTLETMVAMVLIGVSMLIYMGTFAESSQNTYSVLVSSRADLLSESLTEMTLAHPEIINAYNDLGGMPSSAIDCSTATCSQAAFATYKLKEFHDYAKATLKTDNVNITLNSTPCFGGTDKKRLHNFNWTIEWTDPATRLDFDKSKGVRREC